MRRSRLRSSLPVNSDADKIISHLFDVARLVFNLVVNRVRPLVIDPAAARPIGNIGQRLNEIFSILIFKAEQILANQRGPRAMSDTKSLFVSVPEINERIEVAI